MSGSFILRRFSIKSDIRGRLTYSRTLKNAIHALKVWRASGRLTGETVYLFDTKTQKYSLDGQSWTGKGSVEG